MANEPISPPPNSERGYFHYRYGWIPDPKGPMTKAEFDKLLKSMSQAPKKDSVGGGQMSDEDTRRYMQNIGKRETMMRSGPMASDRDVYLSETQSNSDKYRGKPGEIRFDNNSKPQGDFMSRNPRYETGSGVDRFAEQYRRAGGQILQGVRDFGGAIKNVFRPTPQDVILAGAGGLYTAGQAYRGYLKEDEAQQNQMRKDYDEMGRVLDYDKSRGQAPMWMQDSLSQKGEGSLASILRELAIAKEAMDERAFERRADRWSADREAYGDR